MLQNLELTMLESLLLFLASGVGLTIIERLTRKSSPSHYQYSDLVAGA